MRYYRRNIGLYKSELLQITMLTLLTVLMLTELRFFYLTGSWLDNLIFKLKLELGIITNLPHFCSQTITIYKSMSKEKIPFYLLIIFKLWALLPIRVLHIFGSILGLSIYFFSFLIPHKKNKLFAVMAKCGINSCANNFRKYTIILGRSVLDYPMWWLASDKRLIKYIKYSDADNVFERYKNKPIIFVGGHLSSTEAVVRLVGYFRKPLSFIYQGSKSNFAQHFHNLRGVLPGFMPVSSKQTSTLRQVLRELKNDGSIIIYTDMPPPKDSAVNITFFGHKCWTMSLPFKLKSAAVGAHKEVKMVYFETLQHFGGYTITLTDITEKINNNCEESMQIINDKIENSAKSHPEQYLWLTNKFRQ